MLNNAHIIMTIEFISDYRKENIQAASKLKSKILRKEKELLKIFIYRIVIVPQRCFGENRENNPQSHRSVRNIYFCTV